MAKVAPAGLPVKPSPARIQSSMRVWPSLGFPGPAQQLTHTAETLGIIQLRSRHNTHIK